ncbi:hypothetical protein C8J56DRAFT_233112 [Mycena floridula]|nr:hypothetical protein C8J56DRAFT_233112 [Mycena floridula]
MESRRIPIRVSNAKGFIWDLDDMIQLRSKHNICGILTGTLPQLSQQNLFLGIPLLLMPEEVVLLVENELAVLVDDPRSYPDPSEAQLQKWNAEETAYARRQLVVSEAKENLDRSMSAEAIRKRNERQLKRAAEQISSVAAESPFIPDVVPSQDDASSTTIIYNVLIPTASSTLDWYSPNQATYATIEAAKAAGLWNFPSTLADRARCGVFRSLWEQGFFMGGGIKFGGDYLVYPGDPLRYHSHFAATILESAAAPLRPMEIVAHGRLGTATKKSHLLCCWDDEKRTVSYLSIEWAGFG